MSLNERGPKPTDYKTEINNRFIELVNDPKFTQIIFLIDMEGVILPLHFPRLIYPEIYGSGFNPNEDKIIKRNFRLLPRNEPLLSLLKDFSSNNTNNNVLVMSSSQMELAPHPKTEQLIDKVLELGLFETHDLLFKAVGKSYYEVTNRLRLKDNSLLISLDDLRFSKTLIEYIRNSQPNQKTFSALPIKLPPFNEVDPNYKVSLYKSILSGLEKNPISLNSLENNGGILKGRSYSQLPLKDYQKPSGD